MRPLYQRVRHTANSENFRLDQHRSSQRSPQPESPTRAKAHSPPRARSHLAVAPPPPKAEAPTHAKATRRQQRCPLSPTHGRRRHTNQAADTRTHGASRRTEPPRATHGAHEDPRSTPPKAAAAPAAAAASTERRHLNQIPNPESQEPCEQPEVSRNYIPRTKQLSLTDNRRHSSACTKAAPSTRTPKTRSSPTGGLAPALVSPADL